MKATTKRSIVILISAVVISLGCLLSFQSGRIPTTFQNFLIILTSSILGGLNGTGAVGIFLILGTLGLPVFSSFNRGISYLTGETGGFLAGYFIASIIVGLILGTPHQFEKKLGTRQYLRITLAVFLGYTSVYAAGTFWFIHSNAGSSTSVSFKQALDICIRPFLFLDIAKAALTIPLTYIFRPKAAALLYDDE